jgi:hypothetical protein
MQVVRKLSRDQYLQFIEDYYHGRFVSMQQVHKSLYEAFITRFGQVDDPFLYSLEEDQALDHIEKHYVEPEQLVA